MNAFDIEIKQVAEDLKVPTNMDNPNWLSEAIIKLSDLNYRIGVAMALAELEENQAIINLLSTPLQDGEKKMTLGEAEKRGLVNTHNAYGLLKNQSLGAVEHINAIKKRIEVLSWEFKQSKQ